LALLIRIFGSVPVYIYEIYMHEFYALYILV